MVVEHDHIAARRCNRFKRKRAAIDADDQIMIAPEGLHGGHIGAVTFVDAVGDIERRAASHGGQPDNQQGGG